MDDSLQTMYEVLGVDGQRYGPETADTIRSWMQSGRLNHQSLIRRVGETGWSTLAELPEVTQSMPGPPPLPSPTPIQPPGVILWYRIYCAAMALMYMLLAVGFLVLRSMDLGVEVDPDEFQVTSIIMIVFGVPLALFYFISCFLTHRGWHWIWGVISIGIGMTGCCLPACIPLLIFWIKPETKAWLNRNS